jgi:hypothetical protein
MFPTKPRFGELRGRVSSREGMRFDATDRGIEKRAALRSKDRRAPLVNRCTFLGSKTGNRRSKAPALSSAGRKRALPGRTSIQQKSAALSP